MTLNVNRKVFSNRSRHVWSKTQPKLGCSLLINVFFEKFCSLRFMVFHQYYHVETHRRLLYFFLKENEPSKAAKYSDGTKNTKRRYKSVKVAYHHKIEKLQQRKLITAKQLLSTFSVLHLFKSLH